MKKLFICKVVLFLFILCSIEINAQIECSTPDDYPAANFTGTSGDCGNLIDQDGSESFPIFTVKLAIHFIDVGNGNFYDGELDDFNKLNGTRQARNLIRHSNEFLSDFDANPIQNINYVGDSRIRFEVVPSIEDGVYFWDDISDYQPVDGVLNALFIDEYDPNPPANDDEFSLRGLACGIDSDCNEVRQWGWQSSEIFDGPYGYWNYAGLLNHEVFHVLGLRHAWTSFAECSAVDIDNSLEWNGGDRWNSGSTNTMNYVSCQCAISPCQWSHIYSNCYDNHFSFTEIDCEQDPIDIVVNQDQTWDERVIIIGDVIIEEGVTLEITCDVELNSNSRVIVKPNAKLIVSGGKLTSLEQCNVETWQGIKVYGGNTDFDVKFTDATIENTSKAAVSMFAPESDPDFYDYGNGILHADNSTFNNTRRIVEFMAWSPLPNDSHIINCVQNGGKWSVTNWNCQGIEIIDNVFNGITESCIVTEVGSFTITGNEFYSEQNDILYNNTSAGISSLIQSNEFRGANIGYNARGTTFAQNFIWDNDFFFGQVGVMNDGHSQYDLDRNFITAQFGSASFNNGDGIGDVHNNDFHGNYIGASTSGINLDYNFYENCYSTSFIDNSINGQISPLIHSDGEAANNCFTHGGDASSNIQDLGGIPTGYTYLEPTGNLIDCRDAILAEATVNKEPFGAPEPPDCGTNNQGGTTTSGGTGTPINYCHPKRWIENDVFAAYTWLENKLNDIENDRNLTDKQKRWFKSIYKRCYDRVLGYLAEIYLKKRNFKDLRALYADKSNDDAKVYIYSSYIMENDLVSAKEYLNSIRNSSTQMADFITIQNINLDRLPYGPYYKSSASEINTVRLIALKNHPYAAYGKALYYALTGEVISSELPDISRGTIKPRGNLNNTSTKIYPNPFTDNLNIETSGYNNVDILITDFYGRSVFSKTIDSNNINIATHDWSQGIYFITLTNENEVIRIEKVILIH